MPQGIGIRITHGRTVPSSTKSPCLRRVACQWPGLSRASRSEEPLSQVAKMPLGQRELWQFGPNGPPMNVMDVCQASNILWIANQQELRDTRPKP